MLDSQLRPAGNAELAGLPSRVRMSADSSLVATTTFVAGHSYAQAAFSTETIVRRDGKNLGNIESWSSTVDGRPLRSVNRNFWGVTFADDDDTFYATAASGSTTWLMRGSLRAKSMVSLRTDAECPSLSPDQTKIAYKKRLDGEWREAWRLAVLDLRTGQESLLAETRSVDDQGSSGLTTPVCSMAYPGRGRPQRRRTCRRSRPTDSERPRSSSRRQPRRRWSCDDAETLQRGGGSGAAESYAVGNPPPLGGGIDPTERVESCSAGEAAARSPRSGGPIWSMIFGRSTSCELSVTRACRRAAEQLQPFDRKGPLDSHVSVVVGDPSLGRVGVVISAVHLVGDIRQDAEAVGKADRHQTIACCPH